MVAVRGVCFGLLLSFLVTGCAGTHPSIQPVQDLTPPPSDEPIYVVPFLSVMVPAEISEGVFDRLVDALIDGADAHDYIIVKRGREADGKLWLADKYYLTGELFGFVQQSGCCSTELRLQSRLYYHQPGTADPFLVTTLPREIFFDHDRSTLAAEKVRLMTETAQSLAAAFASRISQPSPTP